MIAPLSQIGDMAMEGGDGGAELGAGQGLSPGDRIPTGLTRFGFQPQQIKKLFPEGQVLEKVQGRRKPDGSPGTFGFRFKPEGLGSFLQEVETGAVLVDELPGIVIPAAQKTHRPLFRRPGGPV